MKLSRNMKYIQLFMATVLMALLTVSCDQDLPYPLDDVKNGVVIDVARVEGTDGVLSAGMVEGNYKIKLTIPKQQGDYSMLDYAQLLCVFTDASGKTTSKVVVDNIKEFPKEITVDFAEVYKQFNLSAPSLGETVYFTANAVLKDGYVVYGWNEYSGFNNKVFTGWEVDGRAYSYNVRYAVVCSLALDDFTGNLMVTDNTVFYEGASYQVQGTKISDTEIELDGFFEDSKLRLTIDPTLHTVTVEKQILYPTFGSYTNFYVVGSGTVDACNGIITFSGTVGVDQGTYDSNANWVIKN